MKKFLFATFMGVLVALVGCQQDDELTGVENTLGKKVSVTANIKANAQSRVALEYVTGEDGGSTIKVEWNESSEEFLMYDATDKTVTPTTFTQTSGNQFEGQLPSKSGSYYAVYGDDANLANQDGTLKEDYVWMKSNVITDLTQSIEFKHQTTVLKPDFIIENKNVNASITKIVMGGISLPGDAQAITITPSQEDDTITPSQVDDIFIFLPLMNGEAIEAGTTFNFIVTWGDEEYIGTLTISKNMELGKFYTAEINLEKMPPYVTFTANGAQRFLYSGDDLQYSLDGVNFDKLPANQEINFGDGVKLYLRGENNLDGTLKEVREDIPLGHKIYFTNQHIPVACTGDIRTLIDFETYETVSTNQAVFRDLFREYCAPLTSAPALPATDLAPYCYAYMFNECTSLVKAPELPATILSDYCYTAMFGNCTSLTEAPELPATTLTKECYGFMFMNCTLLNNITMLATDISATNCLKQWVNDVAASGTFTKASTMTSLPTGDSGIPTGWDVVNKP